MSEEKVLHVVVPMAGRGQRFQDAGYALPKPLIEVNGKPMIELVIRNLIPPCKHKFIFICQKEHYDKYDLFSIFKRATNNNFEVVKIDDVTEGAACTVLLASPYINNDCDMIIANSDQLVEGGTHDFVTQARQSEKDGLIMTLNASHPKYSYARAGSDGKVMEVAEKKVISSDATVGIYYFKKGGDFVSAAQTMIEKNIRHNNEFYVCPVYNEMILKDKNIYIHPIANERMHGLGTPEDLKVFLQKN